MINSEGNRDSGGKFISGRIEPIDEKIKRMYSLQESWKNRGDYIADIKNNPPRIYNIWRGIRHTTKGKKIGNDESWNSFRNFYNDVKPTYKNGLLFRRIDTNSPYGKLNFMWVTQEEADIIRSNLVWIKYDNKELTLSQWASELDKSLSGIKNRYHHRKNKKYSTKEILYGRKTRRFSKIAKDKTEVTSVRAKASKMISSYRSKDIKKGISVCDIDIDWMIYNILNKECIYCGDNYRIGCDRICNNEGHVKTNVVPCCYECNVARSNNFSYTEMLEIGATIRNIKQKRNA